MDFGYLMIKSKPKNGLKNSQKLEKKQEIIFARSALEKIKQNY
ncbi:unnamed protein product [Paramecium pentaurelia]|uniref:Uncharacterized protein n=1 Tax=Paramecium pentaurelia TaxID=43138 RepID=A0A8S1V4W1_9CILI|nr:unnamed protein product [Paramecium pentaurelia]